MIPSLRSRAIKHHPCQTHLVHWRDGEVSSSDLPNLSWREPHAGGLGRLVVCPLAVQPLRSQPLCCLLSTESPRSGHTAWLHSSFLTNTHFEEAWPASSSCPTASTQAGDGVIRDSAFRIGLLVLNTV